MIHNSYKDHITGPMNNFTSQNRLVEFSTFKAPDSIPPFQPWYPDFGAYGWLAHATTPTTGTGEDAATALPCPRQEETRDGGW